MSRPSLKSSQEAVVRAFIPRLFFLELNAGRIHSMNADGSDRKTIVSDCHLPDGIVDAAVQSPPARRAERPDRKSNSSSNKCLQRSLQ